MKRIGFIGAYDKTDLLANIGKILTVLNQKVIIVDATVNQKARYIVPSITPTTKYVTEFEDMDFAVGFTNEDEIKDYLGLPIDNELEYDIMLIDTDSYIELNKFDIKDDEKNYFVTSFDTYSLRRGLETLSNIKEPIKLTKILFSRDMLREEDDYLNYLSSKYKIIWDENKIFFPMENGDLSVIYENQRVSKIKFKKLSVQYKDGLEYIVEEILGDMRGSKVRKAIKSIERGA